MKIVVVALAAVLAAGAVSAQTALPSPPPNAPTTPPAAPPGSGMAPQPRYGDVVHPFELRPGDRIRVWDKAGTLKRQDGVVVGADNVGLAATVEGRVRHLQYGEIDRLEMRRGRGRPKLGALLGFAVGSFVYALRDERSNEPAVDFLVLAAAFTGAGALTGQHALRPDWKPVDTAAAPTGPQSPDLRPRSMVMPGPAVRVSLRF